MRANEHEREVEIKLNPNTRRSGGEDFKVVLWDEEEMNRLSGTDTTAHVELSQFDDRGHVGFSNKVFQGTPNDKKVVVTL